MLRVGAQAQVIQQHPSIAVQFSLRGRNTFAMSYNQGDCKAVKRMQVERPVASPDAAMVLVPSVAAVQNMVHAFDGPVFRQS